MLAFTIISYMPMLGASFVHLIEFQQMGCMFLVKMDRRQKYR